MKIEKLACCLAKPMNAIRDLVSKVNELVDGVNNLPEGGGGSEQPSTPERVVLIPETAFSLNEEIGGFILTPFNADIPLPGSVIEVNYNGAKYECEMVLFYGSQDGYMIGNLQMFGINYGNMDAPFTIIVQSKDSVMMATNDGATEVVLSIVQKAGPSTDKIIRNHFTYEITEKSAGVVGYNVISIEKTFFELKQAIDSGNIIQCIGRIEESATDIIFNVYTVSNEAIVFTTGGTITLTFELTQDNTANMF